MTGAVEQFAKDYDRNERGWILFPNDQALRRQLYPEAVFQHPAKMHLYLAQECILQYSPPNGTVLDPFGGTGTTAIGCSLDRTVFLIELEKHFFSLLEDLRQREWVNHRLFTFQGDSRQVMKQFTPDTFDLVLTSPPYASLQTGKASAKSGPLAQFEAQKDVYAGEGASPLNLGRLNQFLFQDAMTAIYKELARVIKPGGYYISITKDQMRAGVRLHYSTDIIRYCQEAGLTFTGDWFKWKPPGSISTSIMRSKGAEVIDDEDIIVFRKES